jgi:hypothetical protein
MGLNRTCEKNLGDQRSKQLPTIPNFEERV